MKVKDLIRKLTEYDMNAEVEIQIREGNRFGGSEIGACENDNGKVVIVARHEFLVETGSPFWSAEAA